MMPTIDQVLKYYQTIARAERMKTGRPGENTVWNAVHGARTVCAAAGVALGASVEQLTRKAFDTALAAFVERGLTRVTAWSYVSQLRAVFAKWCQSYYADAGWTLPPLELPVFRARAPRYVRPSAEKLAAVKAWYKNLSASIVPNPTITQSTNQQIKQSPNQTIKQSNNALWFAATMMLEFAMRNGDILRLTEANFVERPGSDARHYLSYTPHKTELSSGRHVHWPIHAEIWSRIAAAGGTGSFNVTDETFEALNHALRALGFHGSKGAYELRKICIDHVYQRYGAEMATSISGDDIKTITHYYADPAQPNIGAVRIIDLL